MGSVTFSFLSFPSRNIAVGAIVADQLFPFIGDMSCDLRDPIQNGEKGKDFLEGRIYLDSLTHKQDQISCNAPISLNPC